MLYHLDLSPSEQVDLLLFRNVTNAPAVRKLVISANLPAAALNPTLITHTFQVLAATQSAFQKLRANSLVTRSIHTEIIYNVSASRNIGKALTAFGVADASTSVLFVVSGGAARAAVRAAVVGEEVEDVEDGLRAGVDLDAVRSAYGIGEREEAGGMVEAIVTRIAVRDIR